MAEAEYWRFTFARDCQKKNTSENHSHTGIACMQAGFVRRPSSAEQMVRSADMLRVAAKLLTLLAGRATHALDNGLGQTSPMGWNSWVRNSNAFLWLPAWTHYMCTTAPPGPGHET